MTILITDPVDEQCLTYLSDNGFVVEYRPNLSLPEIKRAIQKADALIVRSQSKVTDEVLEQGLSLKVVGCAGAGIDNIDVDAAARRSIRVLNSQGGNTISIAEHTVAMMLALVRHLPQAVQSIRSGRWEREKFIGTELHGKTLGIIGLGQVGTEVARRCEAFGMTIAAHDPNREVGDAARLGIELIGLDELLYRSDIVSVHTPLEPRTRGLIDSVALAKCKHGVCIINCARGGIVNESDLLNALNVGRVAGAALDVFEQEPPHNLLLLRHPHVVATPHIAASTVEAQRNVSMQLAQQVVAVFRERSTD